jgi:transposase
MFGNSCQSGHSTTTFGHYLDINCTSHLNRRRIKNVLPGRDGYVGVTAKDNRIFINGVLWIFKTGAPWRDLPERYGHWKNVHRRFSRWSKSGIFSRIFQILSDDADMEFLLMDGSIVKAHQHAAGAKKKSRTT